MKKIFLLTTFSLLTFMGTQIHANKCVQACVSDAKSCKDSATKCKQIEQNCKNACR